MVLAVAGVGTCCGADHGLAGAADRGKLVEAIQIVPQERIHGRIMEHEKDRKDWIFSTCQSPGLQRGPSSAALHFTFWETLLFVYGRTRDRRQDA